MYINIIWVDISVNCITDTLNLVGDISKLLMKTLGNQFRFIFSYHSEGFVDIHVFAYSLRG